MFGPGEYVPDPTEGIVDANDLPLPLIVPYDRNHDHSPCPRMWAFYDTSSPGSGFRDSGPWLGAP